MMAQVDDMEAAPLIGTQRPEENVRGDALEPESLVAAIEERVHLLDFMAEEVHEFCAVHGLPMELIGPRKGRRGRAAGHAAEGEHGHLQQPLHGRPVSGGGAPALEPLFQRTAGTAESKDEVFDEFLGAPQAVVLPRVQLTPLRRLSG